MSQQRFRIKHLVAEGLAIILSILLAFAIDAWWDASQEEGRVDGVLATLDAGLGESILQIDRHIGGLSRDSELLRRFMTSSPGDAAQVPFDSTRVTLVGLWRTNTGDNNITFVETAMEHEALRALDDPELASAVAWWHVEVAELRELSSQLASLEIEILVTLGRHPEVAEMLQQTGTGGLPAADRGGVSGEVMRRVRQDPEVGALVAAKAQRWGYQIQVLGRLREATQSLRSLIGEARTR